MPEPAWARARNILCVRLDALGDVLMSSPAMRALKEAAPGRSITLLTSSAGAAVAPLLGSIDQTIIYDPPWMKARPPVPDSRAELQMIERLKRPNFDAAVIFTTFSQSPLPAALLAFMAAIPLRLAHCRENPYQLLTDWIPEMDHAGDFGMRHEVRRQLNLVAAVGAHTEAEAISLQVSPQAIQRVSSLLREIELDTGQPWVVIHPGASAPSRRYPAESYAAAAQMLHDQHGLQVLFTGSKQEVELVEHIQGGMRTASFSLAGQLNLEELAALLSLAPLLLANNTGPVHMAAGVRTPVVDLYALTNPQHTPWMTPHRKLYHEVPCRFCYKSVCPMGHHDCLRRVTPQQVVAAAVELLEEVKIRH